jgi:hypothetical protein
MESATQRNTPSMLLKHRGSIDSHRGAAESRHGAVALRVDPENPGKVR